ncbi:signal peptidase I [Candidatus Nomurabacteria bacterium]|nr:signal peptidase I [Candidatus Nomurabacteria bacterium]
MEEKNYEGKNTLWQKIKENVIEFLKFAFIAVIIVLPIRMFIAQPFIVSGLSMFPTFNDGEYLIIDELSYNLGSINRNDVVVFHYPNDKKKYFIKRIIGLPNETIIINNGEVTIKNKEFPEGFKLEQNYIKEKFSTTSTYTTGPDDYFVMGDNRNYSSDSRAWGTLNKKFLVGRAFLRLLPLNNISYLPGKIK